MDVYVAESGFSDTVTLKLRSERCLLVERGRGGKRALRRGNWVCEDPV